MRPVRLTLQAFGPYPTRQVIDFREAVAAGLFGIYGQTGSGKSTIFSAMTFALFGKPAKEDQDAASLRSDHAAPGLLTEVELVFDIGAKRYVVLRQPEQMRPKQRGAGETRSAHEAYLFDATGLDVEEITPDRRGKILAEKKVGLVDTAVTDLLGYGPEQFRQIVLLPQGRFETFLAAKTKERLGILRDLFDVTLYRRLAVRMKQDADHAERQVREDRALYGARLAADGFESTEALTVGIDAARARHASLVDAQTRARNALQGAQTALQQAQSIEAQFVAAEAASQALAKLQSERAAIEALTLQVAQAERARLLLDAETQVGETATETATAKTQWAELRGTSDQAVKTADRAAAALEQETARASEREALRKQLEDLARYHETLEASKGRAHAQEQAQKEEQAAEAALNAALRQLATLQAQCQQSELRGKQAREAERQRAQLLAQLAQQRGEYSQASAYESAQKRVQLAQDDVSEKTLAHATAQDKAEQARQAFAQAEQDLAQMQALHLAATLSEGAPCPVCGATEHPARATGAMDTAGLDNAYRDLKAAWQQADGAARRTEQQLISAQSVLEDRQSGFANLAQPVGTAAALLAQVNALQGQIEALGPQLDPLGIEAERDRLLALIGQQEQACNSLREALSRCHSDRVAKAAGLAEMLSSVPEALRDAHRLSSEQQTVAQQLAQKNAALSKAEEGAKDSRERALAAQKDVEAAESAFQSAQMRHGKATEQYHQRLGAIGLSEAAYQALKPSIARIETDRETVTRFTQTLAAAQASATSSAMAIEGQTRPDLPSLQSLHQMAEAELTEATDQRAGAGHHLAHLEKLRAELDETLRKLEEAEADSGPLRGLAAALNGDNPQKLDLETFAIGAMFDQVLAAANLRLGPMTGNRYQLERDLEGGGRGRRGLGIEVSDIFTGKARPTATLSGGETFIAALALALGLADVVESASGKVQLDTIFIDEGFGSLDTENGSGTLDLVLQVLGTLVSQNRAVGLISHVPLVQEAIPNGFYVRKGLAGSHVEAKDAP